MRTDGPLRSQGALCSFGPPQKAHQISKSSINISYLLRAPITTTPINANLREALALAEIEIEILRRNHLRPMPYPF
jgi:hypothetical protein